MKFFDTCSLLKKVDNLFNDGNFVISSITLNELENIKTSSTKDPDIKYSARKLLHLLDSHPEGYEVSIFTMDMLEAITEHMLSITDDSKILACAYYYQLNHPELVVEFVTDDLALKNIAGLFFKKANILSVGEEFNDNYNGCLEVHMTDDELTEFYTNYQTNSYNLKENQYIIIYDKDNNIVDTRVWTKDGYRPLTYRSFNSQWLGEVKPLKGDIYQAMAADSLLNNTITMIKGRAGSGKTYLSLGYLMSLLDRGKIDKIIIFCNTVATKNSAKLGYLPGTRDEKLLDSQIGNLLVSKLGSRLEVERLINDEKLILLPFSDIRGYDTTGMNAGIYISEAQNLDIELMKLALQRISNDGICIIDGDEKTQVDDINFAGANNGMRRASQVFRGTDIYGEVELQIIHRSKIAEIAEQM